MIRMTSGVYGSKDMKRPEDPPFCLPDAEEARLVKRGVAEYVYEQAPTGLPASVGEVPTLPSYDVGMTEKQLRGIAAYHKVDVSAAKKKQDIVDILDAYFGVDEADLEEGIVGDPDAPSLSAEDPAV